LAVEYRYAENQYDRLPALAADLVRRRVAVIVGGTAAALVAKAATTTVPIVFAAAADPVAIGLVASLNRPGANVTGIAILQTELGPKRLQLLRELIPNSALFGVLADPAVPGVQSIITDMQAAARTLGARQRTLSFPPWPCDSRLQLSNHPSVARRRNCHFALHSRKKSEPRFRGSAKLQPKWLLTRVTSPAP
jgi:hypothetical protein